MLGLARRPAVNQVSGFAREVARLPVDLVAEAYRGLLTVAPRRRAVGKSHFVGHTGFPGSGQGGSSRAEEHLAMAMFNHRPESGGWQLPDGGSMRILDYQFPLKARRNDTGVGKVDLLGVIDRSTVAVIELKHTEPDAAGWGDTPLRALLELLVYCAIVEANLGDITMEMTPSQILRPVQGLAMLVVGSAGYWQRWQGCLPAGDWQPPVAAFARAVSPAVVVPVSFLSLNDPTFEMGDRARKPRLTGGPTLCGVVGLP